MEKSWMDEIEFITNEFEYLWICEKSWWKNECNGNKFMKIVWIVNVHGYNMGEEISLDQLILVLKVYR